MVEGDSGSPTWKFTQYVQISQRLHSVLSSTRDVNILTPSRPCRLCDRQAGSLSGVLCPLAAC